MKKLVTLLLAAGLVFSATSGASAAEIKVSGTMDFAFDYNNGGNFMSTKNFMRNAKDNVDAVEHNKHFGAVQRMRLGLEIIASENLSATYQAQVGTFTWGGPSAGMNKAEFNGSALGTRASNIVTRLAYLDWIVPGTDVKVRMGQQVVAMPSFTFGSPVLDDTATGVLISAPINENITLTGGWLRAFSGPRRGSHLDYSAGERLNDNFDLFNLMANFKYDGFQVAPWVLVGPLGKSAMRLDKVDAYDPVILSPLWGNGKWNGTDFDPAKLSKSFVWFAGIGGELTMFDPFKLTADFYYSKNDAKQSWASRSGWVAMLGAEYDTEYGTPALKGWYGSGDDKKASNGSERALTLSGAFDATSHYFDNKYSIGNNFGRTDIAGTWGVGLYWNGLSFVEDLTHDFGVVYFAGTNAKQNITEYGRAVFFQSDRKNYMTPLDYMTNKDSAIELDFTTTYKIYQNLATALELSYIVQDFDGKTWGKGVGLVNADGSDKKAKFNNVFRATVNFRYTF